MTAVFALFAASLIPLFSGVAKASVPECRVQVLQPVTDDLENHWQAGKILPVTIERDSPSGGAYCASGGSCLPRMINGHEATHLLNCRVGASIGGTDHRLLHVTLHATALSSTPNQP